MALSYQRQRTNVTGDSVVPAPSPDDLAQCIDRFHAADDGACLKQLLLQLGVSKPAIAASLRAVEATFNRPLQPRQVQRQQVQSEPTSLAQYVAEVDYFLNKEVNDLSGSRQCDRADRTFQSVFSTIGSIEEEAARENAHW